MESKTNVMRILDKLKVPYAHYCYEGSGAVSGTEVAAVLGQNPAQVFKTLVTVAKSKQHYVFMLPAGKELDLKKAAASVHEKSVEMIKSKELLPTTGYIHGGCSPIGMKKRFPRLLTSALRLLKQLFSVPEKSAIRSKFRWPGLPKPLNLHWRILPSQLIFNPVQDNINNIALLFGR